MIILISVKLKGLEQTKKYLEEQMKKNIEEIKDQKIKEAVIALQASTPIDTGNARAGWRYEDNKIVNDVEYIDILNQGTSKQAPSNFIEKTLLSQDGIKPNGVIVKSK